MDIVISALDLPVHCISIWRQHCTSSFPQQHVTLCVAAHLLVSCVHTTLCVLCLITAGKLIEL